MGTWSLERAEEHLLSREHFGMRFGLQRMRRLLTVLGAPQRAFRAIHVVGTNGKSSTVRMVAALLEAHGVSTGTYLSPHLVTFAERVRVGDADLPGDEFAALVEQVAAAADKVERTMEEGDRVTQFELLTAVAFCALAEHGVRVGVIEAGLGGRHDATNVLSAPLVVLTNVGLEHTRFLGPTERDIAREKLAVLTAGATLVVGALGPDADEEAREAVARAGGRLVRAATDGPGPDVLAGFQRTNFAVARTVAETWLGALDEQAVAAVAAHVRVPGRLQRVAEAPLTILDGAHNPSGMAALAAALPDVVGERRLVAVVGALDDKDAPGMLRPLLPLCAGAVFTAPHTPRALPPATLASLAGQLQRWGEAEATIEPDPHRALRRARELAGPDGAVVATGSIYLVAELLAAPGTRRASVL